MDIAKAAKAAGLSCQLGAHIGESSLMTAAGLTLGAWVGDLIHFEGAYGTQLLEFDLTQTPIQFGRGGRLSVDSIRKAPGWGVEIDESLLKRAATRVEIIT